MEPNFPQQLSNSINLDSLNNNQLNPNNNISQIRKVSITKTKEIKYPIQSNTNYIQNNNNIGNNQIIEETKIITQKVMEDPINFSFKDDGNINLNSLSLTINQNNSYKQLVKKIANQLKRRVRPSTEGFFHFALQKGEYSLIIIKKISNKMKYQPIIFNNEIFSMYNQKYKKYRELIKRLAHLLKNKRKNTTVVQTNITETNSFNSTNDINSNKSIIIKNNINDKTKNIKIKASKKSKENNKIVNHKNIKAQTQLSAKNTNNKSIYQNKYNNRSNNINDKIINLTNPFMESKEKLSFNTPNNYLMKTNLQNPNQYNMHNKEKISNFNNKFNLNKKEKTVINSKTNNKINNDKNKKNTMEIIKEEIKSNFNSKEDKIQNTKIIKKEIITENKIMEENNNIKNSFSNNNDINLNNFNKSEIISNTPIDSKFGEISTSRDIEMKNNVQKINIVSGENVKINTTILNSGTNQINKITNTNNNSNNNINSNINSNINNNLNLEKNPNNMNLISYEEEKKTSINNNESNLSLINNYNSESNKDLTITISSINKEEEKNSISLDSNKSGSKKKQIQVKLSSFTKENKRTPIEESFKYNNNKEPQNINLNNVQKLNCNTFENNADSSNSIIYQKEISTSTDETSFLKKFDSFLLKNNISIESFIPMAINKDGQQYLKQNAFWEKYINYLSIKYSLNNIKISLFSFIQIIEHYFLWCENLSSDMVEEFKKLIIEIINKIYNNDEIKQFCFMNKINNLEELFKKYKYFTDFNKNGNLKFDKEVEIKINNNPNEECNCELCKSEIACMNKIIELNKSKIMGVNIESLFLKGQKNITNKNEDDLIYNKSNRKTYPPKSPRSSSANKKDSIKFSSSKIKESSKEAYGSISKEKKESSSNKKKRSSSKKEKIENEDIKIDEYLKEKMYKNDDEKDDTSDEENQKKKRKKKKEKSKSKSRSRKNEKDSDSEEKETKSKYNKKKKKNKKKKNEKKDSESEEEEIETKKYKKKIRYPKD